jgi:hypothetical protein
MSHLSSPAEKHRPENVRQVREVVLVEKPRHLVEAKEDLERLFPRCPPNTLESVSRQNRKSKRRPGSANNNNNIDVDNDAYDDVETSQPSTLDSATAVANIIDLVSFLKVNITWMKFKQVFRIRLICSLIVDYKITRLLTYNHKPIVMIMFQRIK